MDGVVGFVLFALVVILVISLATRGAKSVSRAVDREQEAKREPARVQMGMTTAEVEANLGKPLAKADLGDKLVYRYDGLTVEFLNARVSDVR